MQSNKTYQADHIFFRAFTTTLKPSLFNCIGLCGGPLASRELACSEGVVCRLPTAPPTSRSSVARLVSRQMCLLLSAELLVPLPISSSFSSPSASSLSCENTDSSWWSGGRRIGLVFLFLFLDAPAGGHSAWSSTGFSKYYLPMYPPSIDICQPTTPFTRTKHFRNEKKKYEAFRIPSRDDQMSESHATVSPPAEKACNSQVRQHFGVCVSAFDLADSPSTTPQSTPNSVYCY